MEYFAALDFEEKDLKKKHRIAGELNARIDGYYNWILMTGRLARWRIAYDTYYGQRGNHNSSHVSAQGDKGELSFLMSNEYRNLVQHLLVMVTQSRTSLETVAINTDSASKAQSYVAKGLIEYYRRDGKVDQNSYAAAEISLIMDTGWVFNEWDRTLGQDITVDPDTQGPVRQGDIRTRARSPLDVVIDYTKMDADADWRIVRDPVNKFDLAAQYPDMAEEITSLTRDLTKDALYRFGDIVMYHTGDQSPDIDRWTFFHRKSPALPMGRMLQMVGKIILYDGPIPYRKLPGNRICPAEQILSPLGYSNMNDLLALQDVMDALISAGVTNMTSCGVNNIWCEDPSNLDFDQLAQGMNLLGGGGAKKPEVLMLNRLPPEWFSLTNFIVQRMEAISGINSVARGNTQGKDFSGAAMALLQSMSIQFNSGFTRSVNKLVEDNGNDIIMLTQDFGQEPVLGLIIGEGNRYMMSEYSSQSVNKIQRVYCRQSNPMKDTTSGRLVIVQEAMKTQGGLTKSEFAELLDTGNTDCLMERDRNLKLTIDQENEALVKGDVPPVSMFDNPFEHIQGHTKVFASPEDRKDPGLIERMRVHTQKHMGTWANMPPSICAILKIPPYQGPPLDMDGNPLPPPPMMPGPAGGPPPGGQHPAPPMHGGAPVPPQGGAPMPKPGPAAEASMPPGGPPGVNQPGMPTNPLSGQAWTPETGGLPQGV